MARDIIDVLTDDHDEVRRLMRQMDETARDDREDLFRHIVSELARHEAAEESVVHRTVRDDVPQGQRIAESVLDEESEAEQLMADMEKMDATSDDFLRSFSGLRDDVLAHAEHEEEVEFPRLRGSLDQDQLVQMGERFEKLKETAPTHPHPKTPQTPEVRAVAGPVAGMFDAARDAVRQALSG